MQGDACMLPWLCEMVTGCSISCCSAEASSRKSGCAASMWRQQQLFAVCSAMRRLKRRPRPQSSPGVGALHGMQLNWPCSEDRGECE